MTNENDECLPILGIGKYAIPKDCVVKAKDGVLTIRKSKQQRVSGYRCMNCKFYVLGHNTKGFPWNKRYICLKRPKGYKDIQGNDCYFTVVNYGKPCEHFINKEQEQ